MTYDENGAWGIKRLIIL